MCPKAKQQPTEAVSFVGVQSSMSRPMVQEQLLPPAQAPCAGMGHVPRAKAASPSMAMHCLPSQWGALFSGPHLHGIFAAPPGLVYVCKVRAQRPLVGHLGTKKKKNLLWHCHHPPFSHILHAQDYREVDETSTRRASRASPSPLLSFPNL